MKLRKLNNILHRDLGYLFFGMSIIYALSGIALNHIRDWNHNYIIDEYDVTLHDRVTPEQVDKEWIVSLLSDLDMKKEYKQHYFSSSDVLKVFLYHGNLELNLSTGTGVMETIHKRPLFYQVNLLHYNPGEVWKWFSDIFCVAWIIIAISGLFMIRSGKNSIKGWRGITYTILGIAVPLAIFLLYI
jgi:hypothetical protein